MTTSCASCGKGFEAKRSTAVYCSPGCRQRAARDRKATAVLAAHRRTAQSRPSTEQHPLVLAVRAELEQAEVLETVEGQIALQLARFLADPEEKGLASLARQLATTVRAALARRPVPDKPVAVEGPPDEVMRARQLRDEARRRAGVDVDR